MSLGAPGLSGVLVVGCKLWNEKVTLRESSFNMTIIYQNNFLWESAVQVAHHYIISHDTHVSKSLTMSVSCTDTLFNHSLLVYNKWISNNYLQFACLLQCSVTSSIVETKGN